MKSDAKDLAKRFEISEEKLSLIENNLLNELTELGMLTNCTGNSGCDSSKCGSGQSCKEFRYGMCYCVNN